MATTKVCGIETEYGIRSPGAEQNPIAASSVLVNAYASDIEQKIGWDFEDETPGNDARGFAREGSLAPMVETHLANTVLTNGARFYVDHAHPEYSTPECLTPLECLVHDKAGEEVLRRAMTAAALRIPDQPAPDRLQEQLRRQGQLLRLPRELHDGPGRALRQGDRGRRAALRLAHHLHRIGQGRRGDAGPRCRHASTSRSPSGPSSSRRSSGWRPRSSARSSTPATSPTPTRPASAACT